MLRRTLLAAANNHRLRGLAQRSRLARPVVRRFVAGETLEEALDVIADLNQQGVSVTLDHVGESVNDPDRSNEAADAYVAALEAIQERGLDASVSLKASQFGLPGDPGRALATISRIAAAARAAGTHVTIDMEDSSLTDATLDLVGALRAGGHDHVGCAVQAYLHRTPADVKKLVANGASLRLCKGAYDESEDIAQQDGDQIRQAFVDVAAIMLTGDPLPRFATHDDRLLHAVRARAHELGRSDRDFEVQVLHGVRPEWQADLVRRGLNVRVYVPFGSHWYPYLVRRMAERPANLLFFLRAVGRRG